MGVLLFEVGVLITLISNFFNVAAWELSRVHSGLRREVRPDGRGRQVIRRQSTEDRSYGARSRAKFQRNYHKPAYNIAITFLEVFPVFLGITLFSAEILRRNPRRCQRDHTQEM